MIIVQVPFRISFFGGGTDYPEFYEEHGGAVVSTTINKYCFISIRHLPPYFEYKNQLTYSKIERFNDPHEVQHPLVRAALEYIPVDRIQIAYDADLPACSGIGSSSAFAVGLLQGLHAVHGEHPDRDTLAKEAIYLERVVLKEAGGVQDQYEAAFGGFNKYTFSHDGVDIQRVPITAAAQRTLENNLFLMFTGFTRFSGVIAAEQKRKTQSNSSTLIEMKNLTDEALQLLRNENFDDFGRLMDVSWGMKRTLSNNISNSEIDSIYTKAKKAGALGGKIIGAGGGGFMLLYVPEQNQVQFFHDMRDFTFVPILFSDKGTSIIFSDEMNTETKKK